MLTNALVWRFWERPVAVRGAGSGSPGPRWSGTRVRILLTIAMSSGSDPDDRPRYVWSHTKPLDPPQQPHLKGKLRLLSMPKWLEGVGGQEHTPPPMLSPFLR